MLLRSRSERDIKAYTKERNMCAEFLIKAKMNYSSNLNNKCVRNDKKFWKTVKSSLTDKSNNFQRTSLVKND